MKGPTTGSVPDRRMTPARTLVFAIAAGMAVGNLYWAQPLIEVIASSLGVSSSSAATLVTVTQVGYALGSSSSRRSGTSSTGAASSPSSSPCPRSPSSAPHWHPPSRCSSPRSAASG